MTIVFLLLATFILVNLQIYLYQKWGFAHVFYTRQIEDKPIFAGEIVLYKEEIVNKKTITTSLDSCSFLYPQGTSTSFKNRKSDRSL